MKLRANHLTISRIVLLPFPAILLFGGFWEKLIALVAFTLLALTDWLDGKLARAQGPTVLGGLLDPLADKMFLAFTYIPLACIPVREGAPETVFPLWLVVLMFFRELVVTSIRSVAAIHGVEFHTATLAKFKTAFQMAGGGYIVWNVVFLENRLLMALAPAVVVVVAVVVGIIKRRRGLPIGIKVWTLGVSFLAAVVASLSLPVWVCNLIAYIIIISLTLASGLQYAWRLFGGLRRKGVPFRAWAPDVALVLTEAAFPTAMVALIALPGAPVWSVVLLLTAELAVGGLCDLLSSEGVGRRVWLAWLRCLAIGACCAGAWTGALTDELDAVALAGLGPVTLATVAAASIGVVYAAGMFITHRKVYLR